MSLVLVITGGMFLLGKNTPQETVTVAPWALAPTTADEFNAVKEQFPEADMAKIDALVLDVLNTGYNELPSTFPVDEATPVDYSKIEKFLHSSLLEEMEYIFKDPEGDAYKEMAPMFFSMLETLTPMSISEGRSVAVIDNTEYLTTIRDKNTRYEITPLSDRIQYGVSLPSEGETMEPEFTASVSAEIKVFFEHPETKKEDSVSFIRDIDLFFFPDKDAETGFSIIWAKYREALIE